MKEVQKNRLTWFGGMFLLLLLKLIVFRLFIFNGVLWDKVLTDTFSLLAFMALLEIGLTRRLRPAVYWILNLILSLILFASVIYHAYYGSIPTYTALSGLGQVTQVRGSIQSLIEPVQFIFWADLVVLALVWGIRKIRNRSRRGLTFYTPQTFYAGARSTKPVWRMVMAGLCVVGALLSVMYTRKAWSIENEQVRAEQMGFVNYQISAAIRDSQEKKALAQGNLTDTINRINELQSTYPYTDEKKVGSKPRLFGSGKGMNLLVVQMESLQNFVMHASLEGQELTPVMNKLADEGLYFPYVYQQIGQGNTSDAEFMSNTSIYPVGSLAMSTGFGDRKLPSLPKLLSGKGYESSTFHVNDVTFWNRKQMYPALGFDHYYDKPSFENDQFNEFGASDEEMYRTGLAKLQTALQESKNFYGQFITVSSHSPFTVPPEESRINIPDSLQGTQLGNYLDAANYSDYALGTLIEYLKQNNLWDNTVLVVYGDHFGINPNDTDPSQITSTLGVPYHEQISRFNIPLMIRVPGLENGEKIEMTGGQLDIMPTIANIMGISLAEEQFTAFGQDLLNIDHNVFGMRYYLPTGSFFNDDIMFVPGNGFEDGSAISLETLEPVQEFTKYRDDYEYVLQLMKLSDEYVKLLPKRAP
ncbi:LTA synthase family protein [Paenibacillus lemnae]|uniref:LTA synthase family protein n=2 Tax=Paenibacillus lemnae TaxID=1330551 RepID=A0A848M490_PAELE|nr:LTA synthase family protein [Paenibacillus lemnae]NMO95868.1 LTA synthase family protein [Paenibacillus lemnae]